MKAGFSFSPGGLLLPYHLGVLDGLTHKGALTESTPVAGASAGAIAVASHGCGLDGIEMVQATAELSENVVGSGSQRLVQGLRQQMQRRIDEKQLLQLQARSGAVGIAYQQLFPQNRPVLQTQFESVEDLTEAVCFSSTFPFFSSPFPCALDSRSSFSPRLVVDGFFTVSRDRFGCPDFDHLVVSSENNSDDNDDNSNEGETNRPESIVDRTVCVSCFPQDAIGLTAVSEQDCISPSLNPDVDPNDPVWDLLQAATTPIESGFQHYMTHYENGFRDAETWFARDQIHKRLMLSSAEEEKDVGGNHGDSASSVGLSVF